MTLSKLFVFIILGLSASNIASAAVTCRLKEGMSIQMGGGYEWLRKHYIEMQLPGNASDCEKACAAKGEGDCAWSGNTAGPRCYFVPKGEAFQYVPGQQLPNHAYAAGPCGPGITDPTGPVMVMLPLELKVTSYQDCLDKLTTGLQVPEATFAFSDGTADVIGHCRRLYPDSAAANSLDCTIDPKLKTQMNASSVTVNGLTVTLSFNMASSHPWDTADFGDGADFTAPADYHKYKMNDKGQSCVKHTYSVPGTYTIRRGLKSSDYWWDTHESVGVYPAD